MNIFDVLKEAIAPQPMINLNNINKQTLPQITQGLQGIVKAQGQLEIQQQKMMQQQQKMTTQPQQMGMKPMSEDDETPADGSPQGLGPSKGMEPKSLPADPTPTMATPTTPMGMKTMAADSIPILEDGEEESEPGTVKITFTDLIRIKQSMNEQNFVNSKMFSIIAENETPRITKRDFVNYIKKR